MTKARKASQKKATKQQNRAVKTAAWLFVALSALVALSMVLSSLFTVPSTPSQQAQPIATITREP